MITTAATKKATTKAIWRRFSPKLSSRVRRPLRSGSASATPPDVRPEPLLVGLVIDHTVKNVGGCTVGDDLPPA